MPKVQPGLPLDALIGILSFLPPERRTQDTSACTLAAFLETSHLFREAACVSSLWKPHYTTRYGHCNERQESVRRQVLQYDWRLMYAERRRIDQTAVRCLERLLNSRNDRQTLAASIADSSMDVWDVLELESNCPVPAPFGKEGEEFEGERIPEHALTRRYWARSLLEVVSRGHAVSKWGAYFLSGTDHDAPSFEDALKLMSCFFGVSDSRVRHLVIDSVESTNQCELSAYYLTGRSHFQV